MELRIEQGNLDGAGCLGEPQNWNGKAKNGPMYVSVTLLLCCVYLCAVFGVWASHEYQGGNQNES